MSAAEGDADLIAHVKRIRNMIRQLAGLPPLSEGDE